MSKSEKAAATGNSERSDESKPKLDKWWKWLLVYPTLVVSVLSAIPTYIEAVGARMLGVPFGNYRTALKENEL